MTAQVLPGTARAQVMSMAFDSSPATVRVTRLILQDFPTYAALDLEVERPVVALTTDGLSELHVEEKEGAQTLALVPFLAEPSAFAGSKTFLAEYPFVRDLAPGSASRADAARSAARRCRISRNQNTDAISTAPKPVPYTTSFVRLNSKSQASVAATASAASAQSM